MENTKLGNLLEQEIKRYKKILSYNDGLVNESPYRFYNEAEDDQALEPGMGDQADQTAALDPNGVEAQTDPNAAPQPGADPMGAQPGMPPADPTNMPGAEQQPADGMTPPAPDMGMAPDQGMGGDTEIDVTDIVNDTKNIVKQTERALNRLQMVYDKLSDVDDKLSKMDGIIAQMGQLEKQVELMRPPTENERRRALADKSYPYSVTDTDYIEGSGYKTQTDMEKKPNKMSMMDNLMANYDPKEVKKSFYLDDENDDNREAKNF